ncbi:MAG: DUF2807 domain-containing protein [Ignavibacteriae bacterium]|nr:DUF2807 domain-containing protein [Ignavibacteriota bacterium]MCB9205763.1 DUF2807 domain-containing protein [Ignavibacteriales bacterium]MCB9209925.1 DUF2807 domain-containing protein [Ignavibacteriales bacterium]MCB9219360.1 DUF2807 domain-containing protein [Ignavibacteriales bacterium]MCB9260247.1 DUF2807 domain-containing protein [Ignavibacteriales bacterium]
MKIKYSLFVVLSIIISSCKLSGIKGNGDVQSEIRKIENFDKIDVSGKYIVDINIDKNLKLEIEAESNFFKYIKTEVKNDILFIYSSENLKPTEDLRIRLDIPKLNGIECSGANEIYAKGINSSDFKVDLSGASSINLAGKSSLLKIDVSGAADLFAKEFFSEDVEIDVSGAANAEVFASNSLDADVSGAGNIQIYGDAKKVKTNISGAGSIDRK